jgi:hypothetical protein
MFLQWTPAFAGARGGLDSVIFRHPGEGRDLAGASWLAGRDSGLRRDDD